MEDSWKKGLQGQGSFLLRGKLPLKEKETKTQKQKTHPVSYLTQLPIMIGR